LIEPAAVLAMRCHPPQRQIFGAQNGGVDPGPIKDEAKAREPYSR